MPLQRKQMEYLTGVSRKHAGHSASCPFDSLVQNHMFEKIHVIGFLLLAPQADLLVFKSGDGIDIYIDDFGGFSIEWINALGTHASFTQHLVTPSVAPGSVDRAINLCHFISLSAPKLL